MLWLLGVSVACGDGRTPLVVYSPHGRELLLLVEQRFEAMNPSVDVRWLDMGSQDVLDRVRSERANPQADIWFGGPSSLFLRAASDSLLTPYRPSWAQSIAERGRGPGDLYFAVYETPAVIAFNSEAVAQSEAPGDWDEVLLPQWRDQVIIREPLGSGTMRTIFGMMVERGIAETGDTTAGFAWLRELDAQTKEYVFNPALLHQKLLRQEGLITLFGLPDILVERSKGSPFDFRLPASGTPVIEDAIAIVRGTQYEQQAREFVEYVGTIDAQLLAAREAYRLPARQDLPADSLPIWVREVRAQLVVAEMDWQLLADQGADWMMYWDRAVRGRGRDAPR